MAGPSAYVHSDASEAEFTVSAAMIDQMIGLGSDEGLHYITATIKKLNSLAEQLDNAADQFLGGISLDNAQSIADNASNSLIHLANLVLYGPTANQMMSKLMFNQTLNLEKLQSSGLIDQFSEQAKIKIEQAIREKIPLTIQQLAAVISREFRDENAQITISEAGTIISNLGKIFNVEEFKAVTARKGQKVMIDTAFEATNSSHLTTSYNGVFRKLMIDLMKSSKYMNANDNLDASINRFCSELEKQMIDKGLNEIQFMWTDNPKLLELTIKEFIRRLREDLPKTLNARRLTSASNVIGEIGEPVRESVSKAANGIIVSFQIGDLSDKAGINKINQELEKYKSNNRLSQMVSYHDINKQSFTDLVLLNTKTKQIARAQSKNKFVAYFTDETNAKNGQIENFRWMVEEGVNLYTFLHKLSNENLGINLNNFDMSNVLDAIANNIWFQSQSSYEGEGYNDYSVNSVSVKDFKEEFRLAMEKILAGQVTNFLGVTVAPTTLTIDANASNIFYILNGRLKKTADLVREAQLQVDENLERIEGANNRLVNVKIQTGNVGGAKEGIGFLLEKLHAGATPARSSATVESIGQAKGQEILNSINISVSLGTNIKTLAQSALIV